MIVRAYEITRALHGSWNGRYGLIPGPGHSPQDRSLCVRDDENGGIIVHSFAGDDWRVCRDYLKSLGFHIDGKMDFRSPLPVTPPPKQQAEDASYPLQIFNEARPVFGTIVETYLDRRCIRPIPDMPIRYHPSCPRGNQRLPAMVALITDAVTSQPCGLHRTYLKPDGSGKVDDAPDKAILGRAKGGVVRLSPGETVSYGLGVCEGIETGISILNFGWGPVWSALFSGGIAGFPVLGGIDALTIFADHDDNGAGQDAALRCAERWADAGREVIIRTPLKPGDDWNDVAQEVRDGEETP